MKRNVVVLTFLAAAAAASTCLAIDQTIDVTARMRVGLSFANKIDMSFTPTAADFVNFYGTPTGADLVTMGTDGTLTSTGLLEATATTGTPGSVEVTGFVGSDVDISCDLTATMAEITSATTITVNALELKMNTGTAFNTGSPYACAGVGTTPMTYTLLSTPNKIIMGGEIVGNSTMQTTLYDTSVAGGTPAKVEVVYH